LPAKSDAAIVVAKDRIKHLIGHIVRQAMELRWLCD
jgi:hypothetical protein